MVISQSDEFETVNKHMDAVDLAMFDEGGVAYATAESISSNPLSALPRICESYKAIRPFLALMSNLPLIPRKWKEVIKKFMSVADLICP